MARIYSKRPIAMPIEAYVHDSRTIRRTFEIERFADGIDLVGLGWSVKIRNADGDTQVYIPESLTTTADTIAFDWVISGLPLAAAGTTTYQLEGVGEDTDGHVMMWQSGIGEINVLPALSATATPEEEEELVSVQRLIVYVRGELNTVIAAGANAQTAADSANTASGKAIAAAETALAAGQDAQAKASAAIDEANAAARSANAAADDAAAEAAAAMSAAITANKYGSYAESVGKKLENGTVVANVLKNDPAFVRLAKGDSGYSPSVNVESTEEGHRITLTDKNGSHTVLLKDGDPGDDGVSPKIRIEESDGGHTVIVTDADGEHRFFVKDGSGEELTADAIEAALGYVPADDNDVPDISGKQDTLVSGVNIKTVNGQSVLGGGNIIISGSGAGGVDLDPTLTDPTKAAPANTVRGIVEEIAESTTQLFDKHTAVIFNGTVGGSGLSVTDMCRTAIFPIEAYDGYINIHYTVHGSRLIVASFSEFPMVGVSANRSVSNSGQDNVYMQVTSADRYIAIYFYHSSYDSDWESIKNGIMVERGKTYTGYTNYYRPKGYTDTINAVRDMNNAIKLREVTQAEFASKYENKIGNFEVGSIVNVNPSYPATDFPFGVTGYYAVITTGDTGISTQITINLDGVIAIRKRTSSGWKPWTKNATEYTNALLTNTSVYSDFNSFPVGSIIALTENARLNNSPEGFNDTGHDVMDVGGIYANVYTFATTPNDPYMISQLCIFYRQAVSGTPRIAFRSAVRVNGVYVWSRWSALSEDGVIHSTNKIVDINHLDYTFTDFNDAPVNTVYQVDLNVANSVRNNPAPGRSGSLLTYCFSNNVRHAVVQEFVALIEGNARKWIRYGYIESGSATSWTNWDGVVLNSELKADVAQKQDAISDLAVIRDGAAKGATALQEVPVASGNTVGGITINNDYGLFLSGNGLRIRQAYTNNIRDRADFFPIVPSMMDLAIRTSLTDGKNVFSDTEKVAACKTIGTHRSIVLTQEEYDLIDSKSADTLYFIVG